MGFIPQFSFRLGLTMIPAPNVIAGILIGLASDVWLARIIAPFAWGIVFCIYTWIAREEEKNAFVAARQASISGQKAKWGMSHGQAFYFVEYMTAAFTSLPFSLLTGLIKGFF